VWGIFAPRKSAINDGGQIAGVSFSSSAGIYHGFLYRDGVMTDLGTLAGNSSWAFALNNQGQVVGRSTYDDLGDTNSHAFLYADGQMTDLNDLIPPDSGWSLQEARGINSSGQIVGSGVNPDHHFHAFLLTPDGNGPRSRPAGRQSGDAAFAEALRPVSMPTVGQSRTVRLQGDGSRATPAPGEASADLRSAGVRPETSGRPMLRRTDGVDLAAIGESVDALSLEFLTLDVLAGP
jgi:probable HAF family extracellular repeat protein